MIAVFVPILLIGNAMHVLAHGWFPGAEYRLLPAEPYGLTKSQRTRLAQKALDSIVPFGGGGRELREARLPDGKPAFNDRERADLLANNRRKREGGSVAKRTRLRKHPQINPHPHEHKKDWHQEGCDRREQFPQVMLTAFLEQLEVCFFQN